MSVTPPATETATAAPEAREWILVTGSSRGIGRAIAEELARRGAVVALHGRDLARLEETSRELPGGRAVAFAADLADAEQARELVRSVVERCGGIHGLVNNAGGGDPAGIRGLSLERWRQTMSLNLEATFVASQEAYRHLRKARSGGIVNVASLAAHGAGGLMGADYAAAKAGVVSLTRSLALEAARFGVRCNAVSPGFVETDMTSDLTPENRERLGIPLGRLGRPQEIAQVVAFLLSDDSSYLTGQVLHADGGLFLGG